VIKGWRDDPKGVEVRPTGHPDECSVVYNGLLAKCGADQIYVHYGYGDPKHWTNISTEPMMKNSGVFEKPLRIQGSAHICFKDSAANWDNNSGYNWSLQ